MKRAHSSNGMPLLQSFDPNSDCQVPISTYNGTGLHLPPTRPTYADTHQLSRGQHYTNMGISSQQASASATRGFDVPYRPTPLSMQQQPGMQDPALLVFPPPYVAVTARQAIAPGMPDLHMTLDSQTEMANPYLQQQQQPGTLLSPALRPQLGSTTSSTTAAGAAPGPASLLAQMRSQATAGQQEQQAPQQPGLRLPDSWRPMNELQRLMPRLNQEYKREMQLLLRACQVAWKATRSSISSAPPAGVLLDPAARDHVRIQVLSNCNDKHSAVIAAFRVAAQAIAAAAAASTVAAGSRPGARAAAAAAVEVLGGNCHGTHVPAAADAASKPEGQDGEAAPEAVSDALQQLRSNYHQELIAATSALFAICRGFGQTSTMPAPTAHPIEHALAAAQQQHVRVEQLWQDVLLVASGGRD